MKKLTILTIVIVLLALAMPAMSDVVVSGVVKYGVCLGPNTGQTDDLTSTEKTEAKITVTGTPDDNNTVTITLNVHDMWDDDSALVEGYVDLDTDGDGDPSTPGDETGLLTVSNSMVDVAKFESNLLGAMGLGDIPVTVMLTGGWFEIGNADVGKVSKYELEDVINTKNKAWQFGIDVGIMDMVTLRVGLDPTWAFQPNDAGVGTSETNNIGYLMGAFGGFGPVQVEFFYANYSSPIDTEPGTLGIGAGVDLAFGDIGIKVGVNAAMDLWEGSEHVADLGIGLGFTYGSLLSASVCTTGFIADEDILGTDSSSIIDRLGIAVTVTPIDMISISAGMILGLDGDNAAYDADVLRQLDINLSVAAGALTLNTGYLLTPDTVITDDVKDTFSWTTNGGEGGFYIGGVVEF